MRIALCAARRPLVGLLLALGPIWLAAGPLEASPSAVAGYDDSGLEKRALARLGRDHLLRELSLELSVRDGVARLEGEVESLEQAERARRAVAQTRGLVELLSTLAVPAGAEDDPDLAEELERAFARFPSLKGEKLVSEVQQGKVRLSGSVRTAGQRRLAVEAARGVRGVRDIDLQIDVREGADNDDAALERQIRGLLADRLRFPIQGRVQVRVRDREAILEGTVQRVIDRIEAEEVAWFAGGVRRIQNLLMVVPRPRVRESRDRTGEGAEKEAETEKGEETGKGTEGEGAGSAAPDELQADPETPDDSPAEGGDEPKR